MNILIVGCGRLGSKLAEVLDHQGHDVAVVDRQEENLDKLDDSFGGISFAGNPIDLQVLRNAGIESCDAVAAATPDDNLNITVCQIAKKIFGIDNVVARIADPAREEIFSTLGLRSICHTNLACDALVTALTTPVENNHLLSFGTHTLSISARPAERRMFGTNLNMLHTATEKIIGVIRNDGSLLLYEDPCHIVAQEGDYLLYTRIAD